jgi:hypothetical protein
VYWTVRCKSCQELVILKYAGPDDGGKEAVLEFSPLTFKLRHTTCGNENSYFREEIKAMTTPAPLPDFSDMI